MINFLGYLLIFVIGLVFGSFLNVLLFRSGGLGGRSKCFSCGQILKWYDLFPVLSFLILKARCRFCKSKISFQYPAVEFFSGLLFVLAFWFSGFSFDFIILAFILLLLLFIFVYDLKHKIIQDWTSVYLSILVLIFVFSQNNFQFGFWFFNHLLTAVLSALPIFILWFISSGRWMGFGDVKLLLPLGFLVGPNWPSALILAFWIGAIISLLIILISKIMVKNTKFNLKSEVPFAPFLIVAFVFTFLFNFNLFEFLHFLI